MENKKILDKAAGGQSDQLKVGGCGSTQYGCHPDGTQVTKEEWKAKQIIG